MRIGTKIIRQLSTAFYPDLKFVFDELVTNARDAMATVVKLHIGDNLITIEDNGEGMSRDQLQKFFYISHTDKNETEEKVKGNIRRKIIGKFGIGKLSMYRICKKFEIITWQGNNAYSAEFNFEELENKEFIDEFDLKVQELKNFYSESESGTKILMSDLKPTGVTARDVKKSLSERMPLTPDFIVKLSGIGIAGEITLKSEDLIKVVADIYEVDTNLQKAGYVKARIAFLPPGRNLGKKESGVYIKVLGRVINYETASSVIDFRDMTHGQQFYRNILAVVDADGLNKVLLTNRAGFDISSDEYREFEGWLRSKIEKAMDEEFKKWFEEGTKIEKNIIPELTESFMKSTISESPTSKKLMEPTIGIKKGKKKTAPKPSKNGRTAPDNWESVLNTSGMKFQVKTEERGIDEPEARFDKKGSIIYINTMHPMYIFARKQGKLFGALYHSLKCAIVFLALNTSKNLKEFELIYDEMTTGAGSMLKGVRLRRTKTELIPERKKTK